MERKKRETGNVSLASGRLAVTAGARGGSASVKSVVLAILAALLFALAGQAAEPTEHPVMQFTPEEMAAMMANHFTAPALAAQNAPPDFAAALNLLAHLPYTPSERNQGSCVNCWAWAGTGVMEIAHSVQNAVRDRLSVQVLNSCNTAKPCCEGGWLSDVANFYAGQRYAVPWSNGGASWRSDGGSCGAAPCGSIATSPRYDITSVALRTIPTYGAGQTQAIANIKSALNQNKAVWFGFFLPSFSPFHSFWRGQNESVVWNSFPNCGQTWSSYPGHAVLCVGYDDTDPNNRYWIMVNSWGTTSGRPNGVFRVAMNLDYNCWFNIAGGASYPTLYWQTLDVQFAQPELRPEIAVSYGGTPLVDGQSAAVDFGSVVAGQTGPTRTFTVRNEGTASLSLGAVRVPDGFTVIEPLWVLLTPGQADTFIVRLDTTTAGTKRGPISIPNNDADEFPFDFLITGVVGPASAEVEVNLGATLITDGQTTPIDFGRVIQGQNGPTRTFTVRNAGGQTLTLGPVSVPMGYALAEGLAPSLAPGQADTFTVSLLTATAGLKSGQISFTNNDIDENPFNFPVTGQVLPPPTLVYVDGASACPNPDGSAACAFRTFCEGYDTVTACGTVRVRAGSYVACRRLFTKCAVLEANGGRVTLTGPSAGGAAPVLGAPARQADGAFVLRFTSVPGQRYQVFTSTNLVTWELWRDVMAESDTIEIVDADTANTPARFFKIAIEP